MSYVVSHNNIHIPKESFPSWIWYVIEFFIVLAVALLIGWQLSMSLQDTILGYGIECEQVSHLTNCSIEEELTTDEGMLNWIFYGISGTIFLIWYIGIRGFILKKKILQNRS